MWKVLVINGPNLNLLGIREKKIYGDSSLQDIEKMMSERAHQLGMEIAFFQSNHEGEIIDCIHKARLQADFLIVNLGAYSHYSIAIRDAIAGVDIPAIEVHLSNIYAREAFRHHSVISSVAVGLICGMGPYGYLLALEGAYDFLQREERRNANG